MRPCAPERRWRAVYSPVEVDLRCRILIECARRGEPDASAYSSWSPHAIVERRADRRTILPTTHDYTSAVRMAKAGQPLVDVTPGRNCACAERTCPFLTGALHLGERIKLRSSTSRSGRCCRALAWGAPEA
ncbi:MAG: hypothetical protein ACLVEF_00735 [Bifidobacterium bifidum]